MKVAVIFDPAFDGDAADAVWIIETASNQRWFDAHVPELDRNSSIFSTDRYLTVESCAVHMIWNAQDHHPAWGEIEVIGVALSPELAEGLNAEGRLVTTQRGFTLERR